MEKVDWKVIALAAAAAYFFYRWQQTTANAQLATMMLLPYTVAGYEKKTGKAAPAQLKSMAAVVEGAWQRGTAQAKTAAAGGGCGCRK